jgi:hypothetical protein
MIDDGSHGRDRPSRIAYLTQPFDEALLRLRERRQGA